MLAHDFYFGDWDRKRQRALEKEFHNNGFQTLSSQKERITFAFFSALFSFLYHVCSILLFILYTVS